MRCFPSLAAWTLLAVAGCSDNPDTLGFGQAGVIANRAVDEASGLQAGLLAPGALFVHNDDGAARLYVMDTRGASLGQVEVTGAVNQDWEDIAAVPAPSGALLAIGDIGDNFSRRDRVSVYFVPEPEPGPDGRYGGSVAPAHRIDLSYPDGPRDCEALAYDAHGGRLLFITKRDVPPRIYAIPLDRALSSERAELEFLGLAHRFRPPSAADLRRFGPRDGPWVSQPTGLDISADGTRAAVISYRSLYLFRREDGEDWAAALAREPIEFQGPPSRKEEAVAFQDGDRFLFVTTEGSPAPVYRFEVGSLSR